MKTFLKVGGVIFVLIALFVVNVAYYPFFTSHPNYSDVERVFNKMQFPSDWQEIRSSENRGIAGRACPIESESTCYHKSKSFKVPESLSNEDVKRILIQTGCSIPAESDTTEQGEVKKSTNFDCSVDGLNVGATYRGPEADVYISVSTP